MTRRMGVWMGVCGVALAAGLYLGSVGVIPTLAATALAAMGFSLGCVLSVLTIVETIFGMRRAGRVKGTDGVAIDVIEHAGRMGDAVQERGFLALKEPGARLAGLAAELFAEGSDLAVSGEAPEGMRATLAARANERLRMQAGKRVWMSVGVMIASVAALLASFILLVGSMGLGLNPSGMEFGAATGLLLCVYGAFALAVLAPTVVQRLGEADARDALVAYLAIEGLLAIRQGQSGAAIRTSLARLAASGIVAGGMIPPARRSAAVAA